MIIAVIKGIMTFQDPIKVVILPINFTVKTFNIVMINNIITAIIIPKLLNISVLLEYIIILGIKFAM